MIDAAVSFALFAQGPQRVSYLGWALQSLGLFYAVILPGTALLIFLGALVVVAACKRPSVIASYLVFVPLPILIGAFGTVHGLINSYSVIANSTSMPMQSELAAGYSMGLFTLFLGLLLTFPSYLIIAFGLFFRTLFWRPESSDRNVVAS